MRDVDDDVLVRPDVARAARRHDDSHHAAGAVGGGGGGYAGGMLLESSREAQIGGSARALLERPVGPPVHCDRSGWPAEREEVGIAAGVGGEVQLLAAARQIAAGDRAAALQEAAEEERVALLDEVEQEHLGIVDRAALVDAQLPEGESSAPATAGVARRSRASGRKPADESRGAVRNEVRLVPRPAAAGVARGREARSWPGGLGR